MAKKQHKQKHEAPAVNPALLCAENNPWSEMLLREALQDTELEHLLAIDPAKDDLVLTLAHLDPVEAERVQREQRLAFHVMGCSGDPVTEPPQDAVARALIAQTGPPDPASFLFHLGDIAYKPDPTDTNTAKRRKADKQVEIGLSQLVNDEFYVAYTHYPREIVAIPGNHDGKYKRDSDTEEVLLSRSSMFTFLRNFCAKERKRSPDDLANTGRRTQQQPYPYFLLDTPVATLIGLYSNVMNGGQLDPPGVDPTGHQAAQYQWLVRTLKRLKGSPRSPRKPILLMVHYPPFSGAADFAQRGDPNSPTTPGLNGLPPLLPLADILFTAFRKAETWPDAIFCAHAHLYQRLTCTVTTKDGDRQIPCLIVGGGGHAPVEKMWERCDSQSADPVKTVPFKAVLPKGMKQLPRDVTKAQVVRYNDTDFGFVRVSVDRQKIVGEYFAVYPLAVPQETPAPCRHDVFVLDLATGRLQ